MRLISELVLRLARDFPLLRHLLGGQPHAVGDADVLVVREHGGRERRRVAHHRHQTHAFDASGDHHVSLAHADAVGGDLDGRQARSAKAVHRDAAHAGRQPGQHRADAGNVQPLRAFGNRAAANDVFDGLRVQRRHLGQRGLEDANQQLIRPCVAEKSPVRAANRRARGGNDISVLDLFRHGETPLMLRRQLRSGLPVPIMAMMRSCVFGCASSAPKAWRSSAIR